MPNVAEPTEPPEAGVETPSPQQGEAPPAPTRDAQSQGLGELIRRQWRSLWQAPLLLIAGALLIGGLITARATAPGNDFNAALDRIEALLDARQHEPAMEALQKTIAPHLDQPGATASIVARYHALLGDALYMAQQELGVDDPAHLKPIIEAYDAAEGGLFDLEPQRQARYADALIGLGRVDDALQRLDELPPDFAPVRRRLLKKIVERNLDRPRDAYDQTLAILSELISDPNLSQEDRLWTVGKQAEIRLEAGYPEEALDHLLVAFARLDDPTGAGAGWLYYLLSPAYFQLGQLSDAEENLARARRHLPPIEPHLGAVHTLAGRIHQQRGETAEARERYLLVVNEFPASDAWLRAVVGLAEVETALGEVEASIEAYQRAVESLNEQGPRGGVTRKAIQQSLLGRVSERFAVEDYANALKFAQLARRLATGERPPPSVSLALARAHRLLADAIMAPARRQANRPLDLSELDPVSQAEARTHYVEAGENFLRHARDMILSDDEAFADSLWSAADSFDLAGEIERAIEIFSEYATARPEDPRRPAAMFRLGQAHQSLGQYETAAKFYETLIEENPASGEGTRSYVWLARAYISDDDPENDDSAEQLLHDVVDGGVLEPDAPEFQTAMIELGKLALHRGEHEEAIRWLTQAIERQPDDPRINSLRAWLADAYRRSAVMFGEQLEKGVRESQRAELEQERARRLEEALRLYEQLRVALASMNPRRLSAMQRELLRSAYFHRADVAFDLGRYDQAIDHYDAAAQRYADDPASLVAMAQIVNAYVAQGKWAEARTANERARRRLAEFPEDAFADGRRPAQRRHWERWLESVEKLSSRAEVSAPTPADG